jgi:hypothetical protein
MVVFRHAVRAAVVSLREGGLECSEWPSVNDLVDLTLACFAGDVVELAGAQVADEATHAGWRIDVSDGRAKKIANMCEQGVIEKCLTVVDGQGSVRDPRELRIRQGHADVAQPLALFGKYGGIRYLV